MIALTSLCLRRGRLHSMDESLTNINAVERAKMQSQTEAVKIKQKHSISLQWKNLHMTGKKSKVLTGWMD